MAKILQFPKHKRARETITVVIEPADVRFDITVPHKAAGRVIHLLKKIQNGAG